MKRYFCGKKIFWNRSEGSVMDVLSVGICIMAMSILMMAYLNSMQLISLKSEASQLARKYILRMETVGYLTGSDKARLSQELQAMGVANIDFTGTTLHETAYGNEIVLCIQGELPGRGFSINSGLFSAVFLEKNYPFREKRMSTSKN